MKKLILGAFILSAPFTAMAAGGHGPAGCGLGEMIFKDANEWHEHVLAATTNGIASQTFAMTSGSLGCEDANGPLSVKLAQFLNRNLDQLAQDSAIGAGETLAALSELVGIAKEDEATFNTALKANFDQIFASEATTSGDAYQALVSIMSQDEQLAKYLG